MASIGDLIMKVVADMTGFDVTVVKAAEKAGDKAGAVAGKSFGSKMAGALKAEGPRVLALGLAGAFAVASKGARDLEEATARYRAETGATAAEADRMGKTINRVAGEQRMSLAAVADIAIKVKNDMGATGDEADRLTERFAQFARVTRQDGVGAVTAFDDILDAWGMKAADAGDLMDKLIVSQQRYGGSLEENQKALATFAPQLKALGATIDDGIGLLNLFATSGLDASKATFALNTAVKNLKPGQSLNDLVKQIASIEDPTRRAQEAIKVFGARGGVSLANALHPGITSLNEFEVSATDAAGATQKAADVLDNTFSGRIAKAISVAQASLREFGSSFGPALTGLASLATLGAALGGGRFLKAFTGPLAGLAGKGKDIIVKAVLSWVVPATIAGEAVGVAEAEGMATGMAGSKAMGLADKVLGPLGKVWGSILGKAFVLGALAVIGVELWDQLQKINKENEGQVNEIGVNVGKQIATGTVEGLQQSKAALEKAISDLNGPAMITRGINAGTINALQADLDKVNAAIAGSWLDATHAARVAAEDMGQAIETVPPRVATSSTKSGASLATIGVSAGKMARVVKANMDKVVTAAHELTSKLLGEAQALIDGYYDPIIAQDELRVQKDEVAAAKAEVAATKAGTAARHQADLTLANAEKNLDQTRAKLLAAGTLTAKDQKTWLADLKKRYATATGAAKKDIGDLIAKIEELQTVNKPGVTIKVNVTGHAVGHGPLERAGGGEQAAGEIGWVGEKGRELFVPKVPGVIIPHVQSERIAAAAAGGAGAMTNTFNIGVLDRRTMGDVRREMKVISDKRRKGW
jgi:phage-related minor tail protein